VLKDIVRVRCAVVEAKKMSQKEIDDYKKQQDEYQAKIELARQDAAERKRIVDRMKRDDALLKEKKAQEQAQAQAVEYDDQPVKAWHNNVRLNLTYANGVTVPYTVRASGYIDPMNPNNFIHDINEQTQEVQNLVRGSAPAPLQVRAPAPVYAPVQQQYYYQQPLTSTYCVGGVCYPAPVRGGLFRR
jgi:hypothetical protein